MQIVKYLLGFLSLALLINLSSCKDDECPCVDETNPECENYDPCFGEKPVTADFEISVLFRSVTPEGIPDWNPDVAFGRGLLGFKAIGYPHSDNRIKYTWILGAETINEPYFERDFIDTREDENDIPITLIIEKEPDLDCFPEDDGKDTLVKYIRFVDSPCDYASTGDFKVLFEGEEDSTIIRTRNWMSNGPLINHEVYDSCSRGSLICIGFDRERNQPDTTRSTFSAAQFNSAIYKSSHATIGHPEGTILKLDLATNEVTGNYRIFTSQDEKEYIFKGRKL